MILIAKIFYSILFILMWVWILKYRKTVKEWTGSFYWAEKYIGRWGTYLVIIAMALGSMFYGVYYLFT
jgi:hypothetical protein